MATIGYIFTNNYKADANTLANEYCQMMSDIVNCDNIIQETAGQEKLRPKWRTLLCNLKRGDTLIIVKLSNALRGIRETGAFLDFCLKYGIPQDTKAALQYSEY